MIFFMQEYMKKVQGIKGLNQAQVVRTSDIEFKPFGEQAGSPCVGLSAPSFIKPNLILTVSLPAH